LTAAIDDLIALLERHHGEFVAITAGPDYEWAVRNAILARQADRAFRLVPPIMPNGKVPKEAWQEAWTARDAAMAENTLWALDREGPAGRILVYAHNFHVMNAAVKGGIWDSIGQPPMVMGRYLHSALGTDLVIIGMSGGASGGGLHAAAPDSASVDAAFARVGIPRYLVDLRTAGSDPTALAWLREERSFGTRMVLTLAPAVAFDAVLFVDTLTPAGGT
jgi:erythromycin esterase